MKPPSETPKLLELADACCAGACNPSGVIRSLAIAIGELPTSEIKDHPAVKVILGQLTFLCGESIGPSQEAMFEYYNWRNQPAETTKEKAA